MPTVRQNIAYLYADHVRPRRKAIRRVALAALSILAAAALLETFLFNVNFFRSAGYDTVDLSGKLELQRAPDGTSQLTAVDHVIEFSDLGTEVHNVRVDFDSAQPAQLLTLKIQFTDDAHHTYFDSTEYTAGVPDVQVSTYSSQSEYLNLNTTGPVDNLRIEVVGDDVSYPIALVGVEINARHPFDFNMVRFFAVAGMLALVYVFRPRSAIYRIGIVQDPKKSKAGIVAAVAIEVCLAASFLFMGSNLVGVATQSYNYGSWDGHSPVNTFEVGGDNAQQYALSLIHI